MIIAMQYPLTLKSLFNQRRVQRQAFMPRAQDKAVSFFPFGFVNINLHHPKVQCRQNVRTGQGRSGMTITILYNGFYNIISDIKRLSLN